MIEKQEDDVRAKEAAMVPPGQQWLCTCVIHSRSVDRKVHNVHLESGLCGPFVIGLYVLIAHADEVGVTECSGMRLLPENERLETLSVLQKNRSEIERALQSLPLKIETLGQIRRRDEMERRMREIEEGLKVFSRPKVLVKL